MENKSSMGRVERLRREKVTRYSIRKYSFGAASVAVAALFMFLGNGAVSADMTAVQPQDESELKVKPNDENTGLDKVQGDTTKQVDNTVVAETTAKPAESTPAAKPAAPEVTTPALDKTKLENYISEVKSKLSAGKYANKTEESLALLNSKLASAESTLASATTQDELTKAYQKLVTFVSSGLKNKPKEAPKETPEGDTTNVQPTVGKKAENTEPKAGTNSIENTGSNDPRNGKVLDKDNAFRTEATDNQKPVAEIPYSLPSEKKIFVYNEEDAGIEIPVYDESGKIRFATVKQGSNQAFGNSSEGENKLDIQWGYTATVINRSESETAALTNATQANPAKIIISGTPSDALKKSASYTKTEDQTVNIGTRFVHVQDEQGLKNSGDTRTISDPGYMYFVLKSQTYKYSIQQPENAGAKISVNDIDNLTEADVKKIKDNIKIEYSKTSQDARFESKKGEALKNQTAVVKDINVDTANKKVVVTYTDDSTDEAALSSVARTNEKPTVEFPFSNAAGKEIYVYGAEENSFDIKIKDDSGKIASATLRQGGNKTFAEVPGETNKISTQYGYKATTITAETPATEASPAVITYSGTPAPEGNFTQDKLKAATKGENPPGVVLGWRFLRATDADGGEITGNATGADDPGSFVVVLKPQTQKYDIQEVAQADKVAVSDANNVTDAEFDKIKEKVKIEYSKTNPDKNLESKRGEEVTDKTAKIDTITKDGNNLVVTYKDGSIDKKPLTDFARTNEAPTLDIPYSNKEEKQIYLYTTEENDISLKVKDDSGKVKEAVLKFPGGQNESYMDGRNKSAMYLKQEGMTTSEVTASEDSPYEIKLTGTIPKGTWGLNSNTGMTRILYAKDTDDKDTSASFDNNKSVNGYIRFVLKDQTTKYDIKTLDAENKIAVNDANDLTDADLEKIKNNLKVEYAQTNDDARLADKKGKEVEDASKVVDKVEKDGDNLVVTYKDGSKDTKPISDVVRTNNAPEVKIPYSVDGKKDVYVYANEDFDIPIKYTDDSGKVVEASIRQGGNKELPQKTGQDDPNVLDNQYNMTVGKISAETTATAENPATIHITGNLSKTTPGLDAKKFPTDENGEYPIVTRYATATDKDGRNIFNNATGSSYSTDPGGFRIVLKAQTAKYDVKELTDAEKVVITDKASIPQAELDKIKENLQLEYSKKNKDKNINKDEAVSAANVKKAVDTVKQDGDNLVVTYKDGSKDTIPVDKVAKLDKQPAIDAVTTEADNKIKAITDNPALSPAEKEKAKAKVNEDKQAALDKIDDATNATDVNTAKTEGTDAVAKVNPVAKDAAKQAIADELKAKNAELDNRTDLSDAEKAKAKAEAKKLADAELAKVNAQPDNKETAAEAAEAQKVVDAAKDKGVADVKTVNPIAKEKAKKAVVDELAKKEKEIDARTDLTKEEKDAAKAEAKGLAKKATDAITAQPDKEATPEAATTAQKAVNDAKDDGVEKVKAVNPPANKKTTAKTAVADEAEAKKQAIQGDDTLSEAAKEKLKKEVDDIKEATDAAITGAKKNADVDLAKKAGEQAIKAINSARVPGNKLIAKDPTNLDADEQAKLKKAIEAVNPGATVTVNPDGTASVTLPNGKTEPLKQADLTKAADALDTPNGGNDIKRPVDKVIVKDPANLTDDEKAKIKQAVRDVNPNAVVTMDANGTVTVSTPEGKTAAFPASELVRTLADAAKPDSANTGIRKPADKVVGDATNPTDQAKATEKLQKLNGPDAKVQYDDEGNATVIRPDGTIATIPAGDLFKTPEDAEKANGGDDINKPNSQTVVANKTALTPEEKKAIEDKVKAVNPGAVVTVDDKGNATVTTPEGKTAVIDADDLVKGADEKTSPKAGNNINNPADRVQVADKANLTPEEIAKIKAAVEAVNPGSTVVVDEKGNATVTTPEGKTATIPVSELVKAPTDKDNVTGGNQVNTPADRVVVENPASLTPEEKKAIEAKIKAVNPGADVVFDEKGNATVTTPEGKTATIPASDLVKPKADLADPTKQDAVNKPADKVVVDPAKVAADQDLPQAAKDAIKAKVEAVNPGSTVVVDDKGNATVTTPEGKTVVIPKADLVKTEADKETAKAGNNINKPADKVVADKDALTPENIAAIKAKVQAVNPGATVVVDDQGNATVVTPDGQTATIPVTDLVKSPEEAKDAKAGNNVNKPADKVSANKDALTPEDIKAIEAKVKAVNPDAKVFVDNKGNATVSTPDGKTATIPVEDLVKDPAAKDEVNGGNKVNTPATKVVVTNPANIKADEDKIKAEILKVNPGATVAFDTEGNATVTTKDGAVATIPASDLAKDAADLTKPDKQDAVKKPADKTLVKKAGKLTQAEKDAIKAAVEKVNPSEDPTKPTTVVIDNEGNATVTTPDGKTVVIAKEDLVKTAQEVDGPNAGNNINKPADKVSATPEDLTGDKKDEVKAKIQKAVEAVNLGATVFVDDKGNATVTKDGKTATIPVEDLLKAPAAKETATAGNKVNTPAERTVVANPAELTDTEKAKITAAIQEVNPEGTKVVFDEAGNATVTVPNEDGTTATATIPVSDLVKSNDKTDLLDPAKQNPVKKPIDQTIVADKDALTPTDKEKIAAKVKEVNPGSTVFVDDKGNATVTTTDGKTLVIAADDLVKTDDEVLSDPKAGNVINKPADGVFVKDGQITDDVKAKIAAKVQRVNPGSTVFVDENGNATVTTPEGKTATIPVADLTKTDADKAKVNAGNKINSPADRVLVKDRDKLTAEDIQEIEKNILEVNPGATVVFDAKGNATVKNANGDIATIPVEALAKPKADLLKPEKQDLIKKPVDKVLVTDPANLDKEAIKKAVEEVNPGSTVVVDDNGNTTITTEDGRSFVIPAKDLVKNAEEAKNAKAGNNINKPADKVVVADPTKPLSQEEKKAIEAKIKEVNPDAKAIFVDDNGNATVTIEDKDGNTATATIPAKDLVTTPEEAKQPNAGNKVNTPADKVVVIDPDHLSDEDKAKIADAIKAVNPEANVAFDDKGNATVTTKDGEVATIPATNLVKTKEEAAKPNAGNNINTPADKTVVADPNSLTQDEKDAIAAKVAAVNPGATVAVDDKGNATVTVDGKTAVILAAALTKTADSAKEPNAGNDVVKPADKTVVENPESLTKDEQDAIAAKVAEVNPEAKNVVVDDKGNATVTTKDGKTVVIPAEDLVKTAEEAAKPNAGNDVNTPADKTVVADPNALTSEEKKAIEEKVKAVNPGAEVVVDAKGNATVTKDGKVAVIPAAALTKTADSAKEPNAGNDVVKPADKTVVAKPESLTKEEKEATVAKVKAVNPDATVVVDDKGNATVTPKDGKPVVILASDLTKTADSVTEPNAGNDIVKPAAKTVVANPESLTQEEKEAIVAKVKAVNPGAEVVVGEKGNATVTVNGKTAVIPASDLVIPADNLAGEAKNAKVKIPAFRTLVGDKESLTDDEKAAVKKAIEAVNPGATVVVDAKGNATVTMPDGSTATISKDQLVKNAEEAKAKNGGDNLDFDWSKVPVGNINNITPEEKAKFQFMILGAITDVPEFDLSSLEKETDDQGNTIYKSKDGKVKITIDKDGNATIEKDGKKEAAVKIDKDGNVTIVTKEGQVLAIPRDDAFKQRPYVPQYDNTASKVDKAKLEAGIRNLDSLIASQADQLDAAKAKEAKALLAEAKEVFGNPKATQAEVDAMVKRLEEFKLNQASVATDDQAANNAANASNGETSQDAADAELAANVSKRNNQKELPNTGTSTFGTVLPAIAALLSGVGVFATKKKEDE